MSRESVWCHVGHNDWCFEKINKFTGIIYIAIVYWVYIDVEVITLSNYVKDLIAKSRFARKNEGRQTYVILVRFRNRSDPKH